LTTDLFQFAFFNGNRGGLKGTAVRSIIGGTAENPSHSIVMEPKLTTFSYAFSPKWILSLRENSPEGTAENSPGRQSRV